MFTLRQLARQPVKSLIGILLAALSVCVCCVSTGQYRAAEIVQRAIEKWVYHRCAADKPVQRPYAV